MEYKHVRKSRDGDEPTNEPCAICKQEGNKKLYKCERCGRWVCEWDCMARTIDVCKECLKNKKDKRRTKMNDNLKKKRVVDILENVARLLSEVCEIENEEGELLINSLSKKTMSSFPFEKSLDEVIEEIVNYREKIQEEIKGEQK